MSRVAREPHALISLVLSSAALFLLGSGEARADAIVRSKAMSASTIAEIRVEQRAVHLALEIGLGDLGAFRNLLPDEIHRKMDLGDEPFAARLNEFLTRDWLIVADGSPLQGSLIQIGTSERVRRDEITGEPLATQGEPELVVTAEFEWALPNQPPKEIELAFAIARVAVGFVVYHQGVAVNDFRYLSQTQTLHLDWEDPWYSRFERRTLWRQYDAPMAGFIYVEPYEVRKEIIARPKDLQRWVDLGLAGRKTIPIEMQADVLRKAGEFLAERQPVTIDGKPAQHSLQRADFLERTLTTSRVIDPPEELDINSAILGVIFVYSHAGFADTVTMQWDMFDERIQVVPVAGVDPTGPLPQTVDPESSTLEWKNFIRIPVMPQLVDVLAPPSVISSWLASLRWGLAVIALAALALFARALRGGSRRRAASGVAALVVTSLAGAAWWIGGQGRLDESAAEEVVAGLLTNTYRAFDFRDESEAYDVLARSVDGDLLREVYLEMRQGLVLASQGGASARVKQVELVGLETEPTKGRGFEARATWRIRAAVGHWGHIHERRNEYRANLRLQPIDGAWKLTAVEILDEIRL